MTYLTYLLKRLLFKANKADFVQYPLFVKPEDLNIHLGKIQRSAVTRLIQKLEEGSYIKNKNSCLCGNTDGNLDELISRIDMHGIPLDVLLCRKCGLIRSAEVFDQQSNADYYRYEYRDIISGGSQQVEKFFTAQLERGDSFLKILGAVEVMNDIDSVMEIGCGSGGVLYPFHCAGKMVCGFDYDNEYLDYGRAKGMDLFCLEKDDALYQQTAPDLLILSHVFEHFLNPEEELIRCITKVKPGKYLLIEVPGIFSVDTRNILYGYPVRYFQIAHVVQFFYHDFLERFFRTLGLEIVYGDETATFVLKKPLHWSPKVSNGFYGEELAKYPAQIDAYLKETYFDFRYRPDVNKAKWFIVNLLEKLGLRERVSRCLKKWGVI